MVVGVGPNAKWVVWEGCEAGLLVCVEESGGKWVEESGGNWEDPGAEKPGGADELRLKPCWLELLELAPLPSVVAGGNVVDVD